MKAKLFRAIKLNRWVLHTTLETLRSLRRQRQQALLALLSIIIGSASIVAMINIGTNATDNAMSVFKGMGTDTAVLNFLTSERYRLQLPLALIPSRLRAAVPDTVAVAPIATAYGSVVLRGSDSAATWVGSTPDVKDVMALQLASGRFFSEFDSNKTFAVVGSELAERLGRDGTPLHLGDFLAVKGYLYQVVGILKFQADNFLIPIRANDSLFLPLPGMARLSKTVEVDNVLIKIGSGYSVSALIPVFEEAAREVFPGRSFTVRIAQQMIAGMQSQSKTFRYLLGALGSVSLIGAGVGVMNVMLMSVAQRRQEIGVRLALGARRTDIRNLFLSEAIVLSLVGAVLGILIGTGAAVVYARATGWAYSFAPGALLLGGGGTVLAGLFFGLYPAISASRLQPVAALRDE